MKKLFFLVSILLITSSLFAGELPGFSGLAFKSTKAEAEKYILEKNGTISKNTSTKLYWEDFNKKVREYNEDYELNKNKRSYKDKKPRTEHTITSYEEKETKLEGVISYAGYSWNYEMKFYDDKLYFVELNIEKGNNFNLKKIANDLDSKIKQINSKYNLTVLIDGVFTDDQSVRDLSPKMYRLTVDYKSKDDKCSYFEARLLQENMVLFASENVTMKFYSYFAEVDEALGITAKKVEEVKKALQEYSDL